MLDGDWDTCTQMATRAGQGGRPRPRRLRRLRRPRRHRRHGRAGLAGSPPRSRRPSCSTPPSRRSWRPASSTSAAGPSSTRPTSRTARHRAPASTGSSPSAKEYGAAVICLLIDEEGQARDVEWKMRVAHRIHDLAVDRYGLEPSDLVFDALTFPLSTGDEDLRRRRPWPPSRPSAGSRPRSPGVHTTLGVSNVSFGLKPGGPPRPQLGVPARVRRGRPRLGHRPRRADHAAATASPTSSARSPRPGLRPPGHRRAATAATPSTTRCTGCWSCSRTSRPPRSVKEDRSGWPVEQRLSPAHHRRRARRPRGRPRRGARQRHAGAADHQRHPAGGHEGRGRAVRLRRDAAALRAAVGRDHEGRGRLPRAPHGEGRRRRQGPPRAGHGQGRRPRHRQEPRRHHPHQQRLRGPQPRHQDLHRRDDREGQGGARPTPSG